MRHAHVGLVLLVSCPFLLCHLAGFREHTAVLSGTVQGSGLEAVLGFVYVLSWFVFVLAGPVLVLAGALRLVLELVWVFPDLAARIRRRAFKGQPADLYQLIEPRRIRPRGQVDRGSGPEADRGAVARLRAPGMDRFDLSEGLSAKMLQDALVTGIGRQIDEVLRGAGVDIREAAGMDWSAEATSERIFSMASGFYELYAEQHPEMSVEEKIDGFQSLIVGAVDRGAAEAMGILEEAGFGEQTRTLAEETMGLVHDKLDAFFAGLKDKLEPPAP